MEKRLCPECGHDLRTGYLQYDRERGGLGLRCANCWAFVKQRTSTATGKDG